MQEYYGDFLCKSEEEKFELGGILEESNRTIEECEKDSIDLRQKI